MRNHRQLSSIRSDAGSVLGFSFLLGACGLEKPRIELLPHRILKGWRVGETIAFRPAAQNLLREYAAGRNGQPAGLVEWPLENISGFVCGASATALKVSGTDVFRFCFMFLATIRVFGWRSFYGNQLMGAAQSSRAHHAGSRLRAMCISCDGNHASLLMLTRERRSFHGAEESSALPAKTITCLTLLSPDC